MTEHQTARYAIRYGYDDGENGWGAGVNYDLALFDTMLNPYLLSVTALDPPSTPSDGDAYYIPEGATSYWSTHVGTVAAYQAGVWTYRAIPKGVRAFVADAANFYYFTAGSRWEVEAVVPDTIVTSILKNGTTPTAGAITLTVGDVEGAAPIGSPTFTGNPQAPSVGTGDASNRVATKGYVDEQVVARTSGVVKVNNQTGTVTISGIVGTGSGTPSNVNGSNGDYYRDSGSGNLWVKATGTWSVSGSVLVPIGAGKVIANLGTGSAIPAAVEVTSVLDHIGSVQGSVLYRGASGWVALGPPSVTSALQADGSGGVAWADPATVNADTFSIMAVSDPGAGFALSADAFTMTATGGELLNLYPEGGGGFVLSLGEGTRAGPFLIDNHVGGQITIDAGTTGTVNVVGTLLNNGSPITTGGTTGGGGITSLVAGAGLGGGTITTTGTLTADWHGGEVSTVGSGLALNTGTLSATAGASAMSGLSDVTITSATDGDRLHWSSSAGKWVNGREPYILGVYSPGTQTAASQVLGAHRLAQATKFPANFGTTTEGAASYIETTVNATGSTVISIDVCAAASDPTVGGNWTQIGTGTIAVGGHLATLATVGGTVKSQAQGDRIRFVGPATADATAANFMCTLAGDR